MLFAAVKQSAVVIIFDWGYDKKNENINLKKIQNTLSGMMSEMHLNSLSNHLSNHLFVTFPAYIATQRRNDTPL